MIKELGNLKNFYNFSHKASSFFYWVFVILFIPGLIWSLFIAPIDYLQGHSYRIIFIHVPSAWMSLQTYMLMAAAAIISMIWRVKFMEIFSIQCASIGAVFTLIALVTGMLWGKPTWGTYWVWDARLTSELILLFFYLGIISLYQAIDDKRRASNIVNILIIIGLINIPIIHYSVEWWNTLHQGPTVTKLDKPSAHISMLAPLLYMFVTFQFFFILVIINKMKLGILARDLNSKWVKEKYNA